MSPPSAQDARSPRASSGPRRLALVPTSGASGVGDDAATSEEGPQNADEAQIAASVARAQAGDVAAFETLYRLSVGRVYALCLRMAGNAHEAEELAQESFIRAWEKLDSFRGDSAFTSWLHRLTVNTVLGRWRSKGRYRQRVVPIDDADHVDDPETRPTTGLVLDLERAIAGLPKGARTIFVLHDIEGLKHREIAEVTGLAVGTCKTQLHRARQLLRAALQ